MIRHGVAPFLECSSRGDARFSAFYALVTVNGVTRSIESHYQAYKRFDDGSTGLHWRAAKGRRAVNKEAAAEFYALLWDLYISRNPDLLDVLRAATGLSDKYGKPGHCCQATELWRIKTQDKEEL